MPDNLPIVEQAQKNNGASRRDAESIKRQALALPEFGQLSMKPRKPLQRETSSSSGLSSTLSPKLSLEPSDPLWLQRRRRQYHRAYKRPIPPELVRYMRFAQDQQGGIWLHNRYGALIDRGDEIGVRLAGDRAEILAEAAVKLALAKGWTDAVVSGDEAFRLAVMKSAAKHDLTLDLSDPQNRQLWLQANPETLQESSPESLLEPPASPDDAQPEPGLESDLTTPDEVAPSPAPSPTMR